MKESLALKYRPQDFSSMIGQKLFAIVFQQMVNADAVPHGILFSGPSGSGKTSAARILAAEMSPDQREAIAGGYSSTVIEIDAASQGGVADIRALQDTLRYSTGGDTRRVVIYDEAHSITREGWNALLKPIEEDTGVVYIFVTTEPNKIPTTVLSRLHEYPFKRVTPAEVGERLLAICKAEGIKLQGELLDYLALTSRGNVRTAISNLDQVARAKITLLSDYVSLRGLDDESPQMAKALLTGDYSVVFGELDRQMANVGSPLQVTGRLVTLFTELLVIRAGGTVPYYGPALQDRKDLSVQIEQDRLLSAMKIMWDLKTRVRGSEDPAGDVRLVLALLADLFSKGQAQQAAPRPVAVQPAVAEEPKKLTLAELQQRG